MKKFLILILFISTSLFATATDSSGNTVYIFEVGNPTMVDAYFNIFNSLASMFQSEKYLSILKLVFLLGGFGLFFQSVISTLGKSNDSKLALTEFGKYLIIATSLLTIIFSAKSTMLIRTDSIPTFCSAGGSHSTLVNSDDPTTAVQVDNIPQILAWTFEFINKIGIKTTEMAELAFAPVNGDFTSYTSRNDYASYLEGVGKIYKTSILELEGGSTSKLGDSSIGALLNIFLNDCIKIPASKDPSGDVVFEMLTTTGDMERSLDDIMTGNEVNRYLNVDGNSSTTLASDFKIDDTYLKDYTLEYSTEIYKCGDMWTTIKAALDDLKDSGNIECLDSFREVLNNQTLRIFTGSDGGGVSQGRNIVVQAALMNQLYESNNNVEIPEFSYASGKSMAEIATKKVGEGYYIAQMLPYLQMGMRAVLYAFFPFVFLVILLPGGLGVLKSYMISLIWIELWSPIAAILNMFLSLMSSDKFSAMYSEKGFNPASSMQAFSDATMLAGVGGYLYATIPGIAWLLVTGTQELIKNFGMDLSAAMEANMNSTRINQDMADINKTNAINKDRVRKGEKMISLAEIDADQARQTGQIEAGHYLGTKEAEKYMSLTDMTKGSDIKKYANDIGSAKEILNDPNKTMNTFIANSQKEVKAEVEQAVNTGVLEKGSDGQYHINEDNVDSFGKSEGIDNATSEKTLLNTQKSLAKTKELDLSTEEGRSEYSDYMGKVEGTKKAGQVMKEIYKQEYNDSLHENVKYKSDSFSSNSLKNKIKGGNISFNDLKNMHDKGEISDEEFNSAKEDISRLNQNRYSGSEAALEVSEHNTKESLLNKKSNLGNPNKAADDTGAYINPNDKNLYSSLNQVSRVDNNKEIVDYRTQQQIMKKHSMNEQVMAEVNKANKEIGESLNIPKNQKIALETLAKNGSEEVAKKAKAFLEGNIAGNTSNIASFLSEQGIKNDFFKKALGDTKVDILNENGLTARETANIKAAEIESNLVKQRKKLDSMQKHIKESESLNNLMNKTLASLNLDKKKYADLTDMEKVQIAMYFSKQVQSIVNTRKEAVSLSETNQKDSYDKESNELNFDSGMEGKAEGISTTIETYKNIAIQGFEEEYAKARILTEFMGMKRALTEDLALMLADLALDDSGNIRRKRDLQNIKKEKIERMNSLRSKSGISKQELNRLNDLQALLAKGVKLSDAEYQEFKSLKQKSSIGLSKAERNELRRLTSQVSRLENTISKISTSLNPLKHGTAYIQDIAKKGSEGVAKVAKKVEMEARIGLSIATNGKSEQAILAMAAKLPGKARLAFLASALMEGTITYAALYDQSKSFGTNVMNTLEVLDPTLIGVETLRDIANKWDDIHNPGDAAWIGAKHFEKLGNQVFDLLGWDQSTSDYYKNISFEKFANDLVGIVKDADLIAGEYKKYYSNLVDNIGDSLKNSLAGRAVTKVVDSIEETASDIKNEAIELGNTVKDTVVSIDNEINETFDQTVDYYATHSMEEISRDSSIAAEYAYDSTKEFISEELNDAKEVADTIKNTLKFNAWF